MLISSIGKTGLKIDIFKIFIFLALILIVWIFNIFYHPNILEFGMQGDDWGWLLKFDSYDGSNLRNYSKLKSDIGSMHTLQQSYYIGFLKTIFGLNQTAFQLTTLFFKSLAAISVAFLVFKLTKDKVLFFLTLLFSAIFPSASALFFVVTGLNYLIVAFMCISIYFYIQSFKRKEKILLASLFFFLALSSGPARAYLLLPIPLVVEMVRLIKNFNLIIFFRRLVIFYLLPIVLLRSPGTQYQLDPAWGLNVRLDQISSGNLYTLTLPFQMISALFIDQRILIDILEFTSRHAQFLPNDLSGFFIINLLLIFLTVFLGVAIVKQRTVLSFTIKVMSATLILEAIFYLLGIFSMRDGVIPFIDILTNPVAPYMTELLNPTVFQASLGGYFFVLGFILAIEWRKREKENKLLGVMVYSWGWVVFSILLSYFTHPWWRMIIESNDRYSFVSSVGAVIFAAGIFALSFKVLGKINNLFFKTPLYILVAGFVLAIIWVDYKIGDHLFNQFNARDGGATSYWEETLYRRFLSKFGKDNLRKPIYLYIDTKNDRFNIVNFGRLISYRIYYDENTNLIKDNCKVVVTDLQILKKTYTTYNEEKGFLQDYSLCIAPVQSTAGKYNLFYPLDNFYAYRIENKEFIDIKDEVLSKLEQAN